MTRIVLLAALILFATQVRSQEYPPRVDGLGGGGDSLEIRRGEAGWEVVYGNTGNMNSHEGFWRLEIDGVQVEVEIEIGTISNGYGMGEEIMRVRPLNPGIEAELEELGVMDGEYGTIRILPPMF